MNPSNFCHEALSLNGNKPLVYTALSKHYFYFRMHISRYVLEQGKVPLNPFMLFDYFLLDSIERDVIREANNSVLLRADQVWVFGPVSNGVLSEIILARNANRPIFYFKIEKSYEILPISIEEIEIEEEVEHFRDCLLNL